MDLPQTQALFEKQVQKIINYILKILNVCKNKPVSLEVFADNYEDMRLQALQINKWAKMSM